MISEEIISKVENEVDLKNHILEQRERIIKASFRIGAAVGTATALLIVASYFIYDNIKMLNEDTQRSIEGYQNIKGAHEAFANQNLILHSEIRELRKRLDDEIDQTRSVICASDTNRFNIPNSDR